MIRTIRKPAVLISFCLLHLFSAGSAALANTDSVEQLVKPNLAAANLKSSPIFSGRGDGVTTCPVTGEKIISKKLKLDLHGRAVYFCCHGCLKAAKVQPEKFVKPTLAEQQQAVKAFLAKASAADSEEFCNE